MCCSQLVKRIGNPRPKNDDLKGVLKDIKGDYCPQILNLKSYFPDPYLLLEKEIPA
jgi:hypothetical protein